MHWFAFNPQGSTSDMYVPFIVYVAGCLTLFVIDMNNDYSAWEMGLKSGQYGVKLGALSFHELYWLLEQIINDCAINN